MERLGVGNAIPSERQLSVDLGVSRLTVRAALDELVREGYLVRRRGSGTFVREPKIAQELTMTSFSEDMAPARDAAGKQDALARPSPRPAPISGRCLHVSPSERIVVVKRLPLRLADGETMAIETLHVRESLVPGLSPTDLEEHSFYELLARAVRDRDRGRHPDDRADRDERGGVDRARRAAPLARVPVRADDARRRATRSSSSCAPSIAATATASSPSSTAATAPAPCRCSCCATAG